MRDQVTPGDLPFEPDEGLFLIDLRTLTISLGPVAERLEWRVMLSANLWMGLCVANSRSLIWNRKRVGASAKLWDTPALTLWEARRVSFNKKGSGESTDRVLAGSP